MTTAPVFCTKIASKMVRTFTDRHGLKYLLQDLVGVDVSKQQQTSDWGAAELTPAQRDYAASDVLYLHKLMTEFRKSGWNARVAAHWRRRVLTFKPARAQLDLMGWDEPHDIFHH